MAVFLVSAFVIGIGHYYVDIKQMGNGKNLFRVSWAPFQTFSDMSPLGYHGYDINFYGDKNKKITSTEREDIQNWFNDNKENLPDNKYKDMLKGSGYTTISTHAELPGNWNWTEFHKSLGADKILDIGRYNQDEIIGLGLSDESYLKRKLII